MSLFSFSAVLMAGDLTAMVFEREGVGGSRLLVFDRESGGPVIVVFARLGRGGCLAFPTVLALIVFVLAEFERDGMRFDIDLCLTGERGVGTSSFGSSLVAKSHQPPSDFFCCTLRCSIFRESIFPVVPVSQIIHDISQKDLQLMLIIATLNFFHVHLNLPP